MDGIKVRNMEKAEVDQRGISGWGIWEKEPSKFYWAYTDEERGYIIDGRAEIRADEGTVEIEQKDNAVFPRDLKCKYTATFAYLSHRFDFRILLLTTNMESAKLIGVTPSRRVARGSYTDIMKGGQDDHLVDYWYNSICFLAAGYNHSLY